MKNLYIGTMIFRKSPGTISRTRFSKRKEKIVKEIRIQAIKNIAEILEIPDEEHAQLDEWVMWQEVSLEELQDVSHMSRLYEKHKVLVTPPKELPLLIDTLKTNKGKEALEKRLKS